MKKTAEKKGRLEIICGSMFSGKSEELIRLLRRAQIAQQKVMVFKHQFDDRTTLKHVASHNGTTLEATAISQAIHILDLLPLDTEVIGIDEAQFFSYDLVEVVFDLLAQGKKVILAGLNLDFKGVPFGPMPTLMALADTVTKLSAICVICANEAYFTQRIVNGKPARYDDPIVLVGAQESYQARCRSCFIIDKRPVWQNSL